MKPTKVVLFLVVLTTYLIHLNAITGPWGEVIIYSNWLPGCNCLCHCYCTSEHDFDEWGDMWLCDKVWHAFYKGVSDFKGCNFDYKYRKKHINYIDFSDPCLLEEYFYTIDDIAFLSEEYFDGLIEYHKNQLKNIPNPEINKHLVDFQTDSIRGWERQKKVYRAHLFDIQDKLLPLYLDIFMKCSHTEPENLIRNHEIAKCLFFQGNYEDSFRYIQKFIDQAISTDNVSLISSKDYMTYGKSQMELGQFHEAIHALTKAIEKKPKHSELYFLRALAYFEADEFQNSISDYLFYKNNYSILNTCKASDEFKSALLQGIKEGVAEGLIDFVPSLCRTVNGMGMALWSTVNYPLDSTVELINKCWEIGDFLVCFCKTGGVEQLDNLENYFTTFTQEYEFMTDHEKGVFIGNMLGKNGMDIVAGAAMVEGIALYQELKYANATCNLETMISSEKASNALTQLAREQQAARKAYFDSIKIHWDKQNKHIPGSHNYIPERSTITVSRAELENMVNQYKGTGTWVQKEPLISGFKERVDFKGVIGTWKNEDGTVELLTTKGTLIYDNKGYCHVVPARP